MTETWTVALILHLTPGPLIYKTKNDDDDDDDDDNDDDDDDDGDDHCQISNY